MSASSRNDNRYNVRLGELLAFHRILSDPSEFDAERQADLVMEFQSNAGILVDGIIGPETLWRLQLPWALANEKLMFRRCEADRVPGIDGFDSLILRDDAAERYERLREAVLGLGGVVTTAGGRRELTAAANPSRSAKSMHYPAIAFDLSLPSGFFKPDSDPYVVTRGEGGYWTVWCRASSGDEEELEAVYWESWNSGVDKTNKVRDKFANFSELCREHGFYPIKPRRSFLRDTNRLYTSAEWWHFQANDLLVPHISQLGVELLRIDGYNSERLNAENPGLWANHKAVYQESWW